MFSNNDGDVSELSRKKSPSFFSSFACLTSEDHLHLCNVTKGTDTALIHLQG